MIFEPAAKTETGEWVPITRFASDLRSPLGEYPTDAQGNIVAGLRKVEYRGKPALESSMGYRYTDYIRDSDVVNYDSSVATIGVVDLSIALHEYWLTVLATSRQ